MKRSMLFVAVVLLGGAAFLAGTMAAQEAENQPGTPQLDEQKQAEMEAWMKYMTPGEHHKELAKGAGEWDCVCRVWEAPGAEPSLMTATASSRMILGGRYLMDEFKGVFDDMPFQGLGLTGYDNLKKKYCNVWVDNMGTGMMVGEGTMDEQGVLTFFSESPDPLSGEFRKTRTVVRGEDENTQVMDMYWTLPDGEEFKMMEITYSRRK